jgi:hypothetical protein
MSTEIAKVLNQSVAAVMEANTLQKFERAIVYADALGQLRNALDDKAMKPFMNLMGSKLGFVTDKDDKGGYPVKVVRDCLIEAVLRGVEPCGNHFNIIAGNSYITKEGFKYLLDNVKGLTWMITNELPRINQDKGSAAIIMVVKWKMGNGEWEEQKLDVAVRVNKYMGTDAVIGKGERKSRAWLYNNFTDEEIGDGDAENVKIELVAEKKSAVEGKADKAESSLESKIGVDTPKVEESGNPLKFE